MGYGQAGVRGRKKNAMLLKEILIEIESTEEQLQCNQECICIIHGYTVSC